MGAIIVPYSQTIVPGTKLLKDAITDAGVTSKARIILDFGDTSCYVSGNTFTNLKTGEPNYTKDATTALSTTSGLFSSRVRSTSQVGWISTASTRTWSDLFHKAGGQFSWCSVLHIRSAATWFPLFGTWDNTTGNTGCIAYIDFRKTVTSQNNITVSAWRSASSSALTLYGASDSLIRKNDWLFLAGTIGDNIPSFFRASNQYVPINKYRRGTLTLDASNVNTITQTYSSPTTTNGVDNMQLFGINGTSNDNGDIDIAACAIFSQAVTINEFDQIFNSIRRRYAL